MEKVHLIKIWLDVRHVTVQIEALNIVERNERENLKQTTEENIELIIKNY